MLDLQLANGKISQRVHVPKTVYAHNIYIIICMRSEGSPSPNGPATEKRLKTGFCSKS